MATVESFSAPFNMEFEYSRSLGPVMGEFFTALRDGKLLGIKASDGTVFCPPTEYDLRTAEELSELVEVGPGGEVTTWAWLDEPRENQPLDKPCAWALIKLDGADSALLHVVDPGDRSRMRTGMRVKPRWAAERVGHMKDIECFEVERLQSAERGASEISEGSA